MQKPITAAKPATAYVLMGAGALILSYCVNAMDRTLFPLLLTDVRREYGFGLPEAGLLSTIFTFGMAHRRSADRLRDCRVIRARRSSISAC